VSVSVSRLVRTLTPPTFHSVVAQIGSSRHFGLLDNECTSIFEAFIGDRGQISLTASLRATAPGSSADQLFEADYDHVVDEATRARCRVSRQWPGAVRKGAGPGYTIMT
jgi:hypothetical protein